MELVHRHLLIGADSHDLLGEDVERVPGNDGLLDLPATHAPGDDGRLEQVETELGEDPALRDGTEIVASPADALKAARDRLRRLDLDDEVDGTHVDAELERRRGDEARDLTLLQKLLDLDPLLACQGAVVCAGDLLLGELVQAQREPFRQPPVVDEHDRRPVSLDEAQDLRIDRGPDRARRGADAVRDVAPVDDLGLADRLGGGQVAHVLERHDDLEVELLGPAGIDQLDRPAARDETTDLRERPLCGRKPDALDRLGGQAIEPLDAECEMRAALRSGHCVHLVEDQRLDRAEHLPALRGQEQEERLGGSDQDVRRRAQHRLAFLCRGVARAHGHAEL